MNALPMKKYLPGLVTALILLGSPWTPKAIAQTKPGSKKTEIRAITKELQKTMESVNAFHVTYRLSLDGQAEKDIEVFYRNPRQLSYRASMIRKGAPAVRSTTVVNDKRIFHGISKKEAGSFNGQKLWNNFQGALEKLSKLPLGLPTKLSFSSGYVFSSAMDGPEILRLVDRHGFQVNMIPLFGLDFYGVNEAVTLVKSPDSYTFKRFVKSRGFEVSYQIAKETGILTSYSVMADGKDKLRLSLVKLEQGKGAIPEGTFEIKNAKNAGLSKNLRELWCRTGLSVGLRILLSRFVRSRMKATDKQIKGYQGIAHDSWDSMLRGSIIPAIQDELKLHLSDAWKQLGEKVPDKEKRAARLSKDLPTSIEDFMTYFKEYYRVDEDSIVDIYVSLLKEAKTEDERSQFDKYFRELTDINEKVHAQLAVEFVKLGQAHIKTLTAPNKAKKTDR
jgi:hypothetical protein